MKGMSLEVRVGLMLLAAIAFPLVLLWSVGALTEPEPSRLPERGDARSYPPNSLEQVCAPERTVVCRCESNGR